MSTTDPNACPPAAAVRDLLLGRGPDGAADRFAEHLDGCDRCAELVGQLDLDSVVTRALGPGGPAAVAPSSEFGQVVQQIESLTSHPSGPPSGPGGAGREPDPPPAFLPVGPGESGLGWVAHYRVVRRLGAGGMGVVYEAEDTHLRRPVALKLLRSRKARDAAARDRFLREARAAAAIKHDHIVTIYQVGEAPAADGGTLSYLAMERLDGESLHDYLARDRTPPPDLVALVARQAAAGLAAAHGKGLIHRDVKPANLWLEQTPDGVRVKLLDFGLAAPVDTTGGDGRAAGTPGYMAPEQHRAEPLDGRADLFGLGCVLFEMCAGRPAFPGGRRTGRRPDTPLGLVAPHTPPDLAALVDRMLAESPADRPPSARHVIAELTGTDPAPSAESAAGPAAPPVPLARRRFGLLTGVAAVIGCVLLLAPWPLAVAPPTAGPPVDPPADTPQKDEAGTVSDAWVARVGALPPHEQLGAVVTKLRELNPGYTGRVDAFHIDWGHLHRGKVVRLRILTDAITDLRPLRGLPDLRFVGCTGSVPQAGALTDVRPLANLPHLLEVDMWFNPRLTDVTPLAGLKLRRLQLEGTAVSDLGVVAGMPLDTLTVHNTRVRDLGPVAGLAKLDTLFVDGCPLVSLAPLTGSKLRTLQVDPGAPGVERVLKTLPNLTTLNGKPANEFRQTGRVPPAPPPKIPPTRR